MKEKILAALAAISGQYNLPKEQLDKIVELAPSDLTEDKISSWVESMRATMSLMQSYADSRVSGQRTELDNLKREFEDYKKNNPTNKPNADLEGMLGTMRTELEASFEEKLKGYSDLRSKYEELVQQQTSVAKLEKERQFAEIKKRVARELGLSDKALSVLEGRLNADMDESKINEILSDGKKILVELGLPTIGTGRVSLTSSEAARARANAYLDSLAKQQQK